MHKQKYKFFCKECGFKAGQYDTLDELLRNHPTLKNYPYLIAVAKIDKKGEMIDWEDYFKERTS